MHASLVWNGRLYRRVGPDQLPPPTSGEGWVVDGGLWKLQSFGPGPRGAATVPHGEPFFHPGSVAGPGGGGMGGSAAVAMAAMGGMGGGGGGGMGGAIAPVPSPGGGAPGTLAPSGYPASSAPPVPAGAMGLTDATINPGGSPYGTAALPPYPRPSGGGWWGWGWGWGSPWWGNYGWGWPYNLQWLTTEPSPEVPSPLELYDPPISGDDRYRYCRRIYRRYCRRYPAAPYCKRWGWFCEPFTGTTGNARLRDAVRAAVDAYPPPPQPSAEETFAHYWKHRQRHLPGTEGAMELHRRQNGSRPAYTPEGHVWGGTLHPGFEVWTYNDMAALAGSFGVMVVDPRSRRVIATYVDAIS